MTSVESTYSDNGHGEHSLDRDGPLLVGRKDADIFDAFLDEFTGGDWASPSAKEMRSTSPFADEDDYGYERRFFASDSLTSSIVTGVDSPSQTPTADNEILRKSSTGNLETRASSSPESDERNTGADVTISPDASIAHAILAYSSVRTLTNTTYLRRMHLSREDAIALFPDVRKTMESAFTTDVKGNVSPGHFQIGTPVSVEDGRARRWPVVLEFVRTAGQRHVRLNKGWARMCIANRFFVGKSVRLARWESSSKGALVTVSTV